MEAHARELFRAAIRPDHGYGDRNEARTPVPLGCTPHPLRLRDRLVEAAGLRSSESPDPVQRFG
jgi:hypothetical protein